MLMGNAIFSYRKKYEHGDVFINRVKGSIRLLQYPKLSFSYQNETTHTKRDVKKCIEKLH